MTLVLMILSSDATFSTEVFGSGAGAHTLTLPLYASVVVNFDEL